MKMQLNRNRQVISRIFLAAVVLAPIACGVTIFFIFWAISYFESSATPHAMTTTAMYVDEERIFGYIREHHALPEKLSELPQSDGKMDGTKDGWGRPILYFVGKHGVVTLVSLGSDGRPGGTGDAVDIFQWFATKDVKGNWIIIEPSKYWSVAEMATIPSSEKALPHVVTEDKEEATINTMSLLTNAPTTLGDTFRCEAMVQAVNNLRHLGKNPALLALKQYLDTLGPYPQGEQREKVLLICRLLFVRPNGWPFPRLGQPVPDIDWSVADQIPLFPIIQSHGIPFLVIRGYESSGYTGDTPEKCLKLCEDFSLIPADLPTVGYKSAAEDVISNEPFSKLYLTPRGKDEATKMIRTEAGGE